MGFFDGSARFGYRQLPGANGVIDPLEHFNPYEFLRPADAVERGYRHDVKDLFSGNVAYDKIKGLMPSLAAIDAGYAQGNRLAENALTTGAGGVGDQDLARQQAAEIQSQNGQKQSADKLAAVSDYRKEATGGYENARGNRFQQALAAGSLGLQGKEAAASAYINSFKPPTSQGSSLFDKIKGIAGVVAAPFTGGASLTALGGGGNGIGSVFGAGGFNPNTANAGGYSNLTRSSGPNFMQMAMDTFRRPGTKSSNGQAAATAGAAGFNPGGFFNDNRGGEYGAKAGAPVRRAYGMPNPYMNY